MLKLRGFDTTKQNFASHEVKGWNPEGSNQGRPFNALWIDRSDERPMFLSFTKSFMEETMNEDSPLYNIFNVDGITEIGYDFNFVFKNNNDSGKGKNPPILNLTDSIQGVDIMAMRMLVSEDEMITNVNTCLGVNNYTSWVSKEKQELILVSSFDSEDSCLEVFVQNMNTKLVTKYIIGFDSCYAAEPFPGSKNFQVPDQLRVPITKYVPRKPGNDTLVFIMDDDELTALECRIVASDGGDVATIPCDAPYPQLLSIIRNLTKEHRGKKVVLIRTTPIVTGLILKLFHNNVSVLHQQGDSGTLVKIV